MSLNIGIVGLPNVGKSTLFNALVENAQAEAKNFPFTTIEPNVGIVAVPDERLDKLAVIEKSARKINTTVEFVDIAGLIRGAHKGEGLGNQFLSHIREVDAICLVLRAFAGDVIHVEGSIDPRRDAETILTELALADLATLQKKQEALSYELKKPGKAGEAAKELLKLTEKIKPTLDEGRAASSLSLNDDEIVLAKQLHLLTLKPFLVVLNVGEKELGSDALELQKQYGLDKLMPQSPVMIISAQLEAEIAALAPAERKEFMASWGLEVSGLARLAKTAYRLLGLVTFLTAGPMEARAWTVTAGATAPQAAGVIHTDFEKKFIRAEVVGYDDFVSSGGWKGAPAKGLMHLEGKEYVVKDGDVVFFRHG
jgi:hypothetical protein